MAGQNISHEGHRQRMRARVEQYGLESLAPHEALEYLLYITNARRDTNGIAHALLERFGSFAGVLEASEEELCRVPGVGPASARMLHLLPEVSRYYEHSRTSTEGALTTTERLAAYLKPRFAGAKQEKALLLSLDSRSRVKSVYWLKEGNTRMVSLEVKDVVSAALRGGTGKRRALPQPPQRCAAALPRRPRRHREHRPCAGAGQDTPAGPHHPRRKRLLLHAGIQPPAVLRLRDRRNVTPIWKRMIYIIK